MQLWSLDKYFTAIIHNHHHYHCINYHFIKAFIEAAGIMLQLVLQVLS